MIIFLTMKIRGHYFYFNGGSRLGAVGNVVERGRTVKPQNKCEGGEVGTQSVQGFPPSMII